MSNCKGCGITIVCPGGCGQICLSDCTECVGWCEPAVVEFDEAREAVDGSMGIKICTQGVAPDSLRGSLQAYLGMPLEWASTDEGKRPGDLQFSGSVDELLDHAGLRRAESSAA